MKKYMLLCALIMTMEAKAIIVAPIIIIPVVTKQINNSATTITPNPTKSKKIITTHDNNVKKVKIKNALDKNKQNNKNAHVCEEKKEIPIAKCDSK